MVDLKTAYQSQNEQITQDNVQNAHDADILAFPYDNGITAKTPENEADMIEHRMMLPLHGHEMDAVLHMIQNRAKTLGQELWVATGHFLLDMGMEDLGDLRRCDLVRAIKHLMPSTLAAQSAI